MNVTVLGLGYVGCVSAACLARNGHRVIGVDLNPLKVDLINSGKSPIVEAGVEELLAEVVADGRLTATANVVEAIAKSELSLVCVGTPSRENGSLDLEHIRRVAAEIGRALRESEGYHVVAVRSTMLPGSLEREVTPLVAEHSNRRAGVDFGVAVNPEFLREGSALADYSDPPFTLVGADDSRSGDVVAAAYSGIAAPVVRTSIRTAEMVKYSCNAYHGLKVTFANEIGSFCKSQGIDSHEVMDIFKRDTRLNISPSYLTPGFAFGGSCLPKDLRALTHRARSEDLDLPLLNAIIPSNEHHLSRALKLIHRTEKKNVGILGLSFKAGTDDLRESPMVQLVEALIGKGYQLRIYDENVSLARIVGSNKEYIEHAIPHISSLLVSDSQEVLDHAEVLVVGTRAPEFRAIIEKASADQVIIDLVRLEGDPSPRENYEGICW